jgi:putative transposase
MIDTPRPTRQVVHQPTREVVRRHWGYDFTHFSRACRVAVAILDIVSRKWLGTVVSAEETSTQVEVAFTAAL